VGDGKLAALETRAFLQAGGDFYLCPLSEHQLPVEALDASLTPVWAEDQGVPPITRVRADGTAERIAQGYERADTLRAVVEGHACSWEERRLVVRSVKQAQAAEAARRGRLAKAQAPLAALNERGRGKRRFPAVEPLRQATEAVLHQYRVQGLLRVRYEGQVHERCVRGYGGRPARRQEERDVHVTAVVDEEALDAAVRRLGWRVYATNQPAASLSLPQAGLAYREQYIVERSFGRLQGRPLSLTPMYVERDDHATGLMRLLSLGFRVLTLLEFVVRRRLATAKTPLAGLYAGNPQRGTTHPTAERLLDAFQDLTLTIVRTGCHRWAHLTPLSTVQERILTLLDFPTHIYMRLCADFPKPP
jgi:transposase